MKTTHKFIAILLIIAITATFTPFEIFRAYASQAPALIVVGHTDGTVTQSDVNSALETAEITKTDPFAVTFSNGVTTIGSNAFRDCIGLTEITIPDSIADIGGNAFRDCTGLTEITIPNSVINIDNYAFSYCSGLESVIIGNGVKNIGNWSFLDCSGLTSVTFKSATPPSFGSSVFLYTPLSTIYVLFGSKTAYQSVPQLSGCNYIEIIFDEGEGTETSPYIINTDEELAWLNRLLGYGFETSGIYFKLGNDIDLSNYGEAFNNSKGFMPIGNDEYPFEGNFDGGGHKITGLYIKDRTLKYSGLFGYVGVDGKVENLDIDGANIIEGGQYTGGIVGYLEGDIENCSVADSEVTSNPTNAQAYAGGLTGFMEGSGSISYSYNVGSVIAITNNRAFSGGLVGYIENKGGDTQEANIDNCYSKGTVTADSSAGSAYASAGGLVGEYRGRVVIKNCYTTDGIVNATSGGSNSSNVGTRAGGLIGTNFNIGDENDPEYSRSSSRIMNCYSAIDVIAYASGGNSANTSAGGLVGYDEVIGFDVGAGKDVTRVIVEDCYYLSTQNVKGETRVGGTLVYSHNVEVGESLTDTQMKVQSHFNNWDFGENWDFEIGVNNDYPILQNINNYAGIAVTGIELDQGEIIMSLGQTRSLNATVLPDNATVKFVNWTSICDEKVVKVGSNGAINTVAAGRSTVTATTWDGKHTAICEVVVLPRVAVPQARVVSTPDADNLKIELFSTDGADIYYTINNSEPSQNQNATTFLYTEPITITTDTYIKAKAFMDFDDNGETFTGASGTAGFLYKALKSANPTASHESGVLPWGTLVYFSGATQGSTLRYEVGDYMADFPAPTEDSPVASSAIQVNENLSVKVKSFRTNYFDSNTVTFNYQAQVAMPVFAPKSDTAVPIYSTVPIMCETPGTVIRFTTDGTEPTETSPLYSLPIEITADTTIKAKAFKENCVASETATIKLVIEDYPLSIESDAGEGGTVACDSEIKLSCSDINIGSSELWYTTDGTMPCRDGSNSKLAWKSAIGGGGVSTPIKIDSSVIVDGTVTIWANMFDTESGKAIGNKPAKRFQYKAVTGKPNSNYLSDYLGIGDEIILSSITKSASIKYTITYDGKEPADPDVSGISYTSSTPIKIQGNIGDVVRIRAKAYSGSGLPDSDTVSFTYTIAERVATPTANRASGSTINGGERVSFSSSTTGVTIRYTTNGTEPNANSPIYANPIMIPIGSSQTTVKVKAFRDDMAASLTASFTYKVGTPESASPDLGKTSYQIPTTTPFIGGSQFKLGFEKLPATIIYDVAESKIMVTIGLSGIEYENQNEAKNTFDKLKKAFGSEYAMRSAINKKQAILTNVTAGAKVIGYLEGVLPKNGEPAKLSGQIGVEVYVGTRVEFIVFPVPPIITSLSFDTNANIKGGIEWIIGQSLKPRFDLGAEISLEVRGGIGFPYVGGVGAYGRGAFEFDWNFIDTPHMQITGELGTYQTLLGGMLEWKQCLAGPGVLWENYSKTQKLNNFSAPVSFDDQSNNYTIAPRSYLPTQSEWQDDSSQIVPFNNLFSPFNITPFNSTSVNEPHVLQESVYDQTAPLIAEANGKRVMVFLADDGSRSDMNRTTLMYSVYNAATDKWDEPLPIYDNETADFYPNIASDGDNIWVTWHDSKRQFAENATLEDMLSAAEIAVARFDGTAFTDVKMLTDNNILDTQPKIAVSGDNVSVVWVQNENNDIFGTSGYDNKIMASQFAGNSWSTPVALESGLGAVVDMDIGYFGGSSQVAYITDNDNDLETIDDRNMYVKSLTENTVATPVNGNLVSNPKFTTINGVSALSWYETVEIPAEDDDEESSRGGNIRCMTESGQIKDLFDENDMSTDNYKIVSNNAGRSAVIYPHIEDQKGIMLARLYDSETSSWGSAFKLADTGDFASYYDCVYDNAGNFYIAYNSSRMAIIGEGDTADLVETNDLCVVKAQPLPNLRLTDVTYLNEEVKPGQPLNVSAYIENIGGVAADSVSISVDGKPVGTFPIDNSLQPGEATMIDFEMDLPANMPEQSSFVISIEPDSLVDFDTRDNNYTLKIGHPDLTLLVEKQENDEDSEISAIEIDVTVTNESNYPVTANLIVRRGALDGEILTVSELGEIKVQGKATEEFIIVPEAFVPEDEDFELLYFEVVSDKQELYATNKSDFVVVNAPLKTHDILLDPSADITFDEATEGYGEPEALSVTISNAGNQPTGELTIALSGTNTDCFTLNKETINNIGVGTNSTFTIKPKAGLAPGTYTATVTVSGNNGILRSFDVSFTVNEGSATTTTTPSSSETTPPSSSTTSGGTGTTTTPTSTTTGTGTVTTTTPMTTTTGTEDSTTPPASTTPPSGTSTPSSVTTTSGGTVITSTPASTTTETDASATPVITTTGTGANTTPDNTTTGTGIFISTTPTATTTGAITTTANTTSPTTTTPSVNLCDSCDKADCPDCSEKGKWLALGDVDGKEGITIFDALEILKYLVGMNNVMQNNEGALRAGIISENGFDSGEPTIFCALEVLKFLVNMKCRVDGVHINGTPIV